MNIDENEFINCPYCWEQLEVAVDCTQSEHAYVEDCYVCCRPIHFNVSVDEDGVPSVCVRTDND
jgi:hypothetical protein